MRSDIAQEADDLAKRRVDSTVLNQLAAMHLHFGSDQKALCFLKFSDLILPNEPATLRLLAQAEFRLKRPGQALEAVRAFEEISPAHDDAELTRIKGLSLAAMGQIDAARATLTQ